MENGNELVIIQNNKHYFDVGCEVTIMNKSIPDGEYLIEKGLIKLYVFGNKITRISYLKKYDVIKSTQVLIEQDNEYDFKKGDKVWMDGEIAKDGKYKINQFPPFIVQKGVIIKIGIRPDNLFLIGFISFMLIFLIYLTLNFYIKK